MKILSLSSKLPYPPKDGGAIGTMNISVGLAKNGHEMSMLTLNTKKHYFPPEELPQELTKLIHFITVPVDTSIKPIKAVLNFLFSSAPYNAKRFFSNSFNTRLIELLNESSFDVIQLEGPYMAYYLPTIKKYSNAKISLRAHNAEYEIWKRTASNEKGIIKKWYIGNLASRIQKMEAQLIREIDFLVPVSDRDRENLCKYNPKIKSITIPAGIDLNEYPFHKVKESGSLFFIGALDWVPNQEGLVWMIEKVLPLLTAKNKELKIHIAGRNAPEWLIKQFQHPSIEFHGEVDDAMEYMNSFDIMLAPLLSGSGIRVKILEGMALGKCIISTTIGAEGIPVKNEEDILIADDENAFADQILCIVENPELSQKISKNARALISNKFDIFTITAKLGEFYKKSL